MVPAGPSTSVAPGGPSFSVVPAGPSSSVAPGGPYFPVVPGAVRSIFFCGSWILEVHLSFCGSWFPGVHLLWFLAGSRVYDGNRNLLDVPDICHESFMFLFLFFFFIMNELYFGGTMVLTCNKIKA